MNRPPQLSDVAVAAGVSVPTVSRVLNGTARVSDERRSRVLAAVRDLGYRPNAAAQALARGRRSAVSVVASNTTRYGYAMSIHGVEQAARQAGYTVGIAVVEDDTADDVVARTVDLIMSQPLAGVVVLEFDAPGAAVLGGLPTGVPVVAASPMVPKGSEVPHVAMDDRAGARIATRHLLELGHRTVHHVAIPGSGLRHGRAAGWADELRRAGAERPEMIQADWEPATAHAIGAELAAREDVTAILCGNDELALALIGALQAAGRRVPDDVSVIGFDGQPLGEFWSPALTTVRQDFAALGRCAFERLLTLVEGDEPAATTRLVPELVVRASTGRRRRTRASSRTGTARRA